MMVEPAELRCPDCDGAVRVLQPCGTCHGRGLVPAPDPCRRCGKEWSEHSMFFDSPPPDAVGREGKFRSSWRGLYCP